MFFELGASSGARSSCARLSMDIRQTPTTALNRIRVLGILASFTKCLALGTETEDGYETQIGHPNVQSARP